MKRLLGALALLMLFASAADAALSPIQALLVPGGPGIPNRTVDGRKPVCVVTNSEWEAASDQNTFNLTDNLTYGSSWSTLSKDGRQQVDFINSSTFRAPATATADSPNIYNIWRYLGDKYAVVVVRDIHNYFSGDATYRRKFFCPDSTSAHVIHIGTAQSLSDYADPGYMVGTGSNNASSGSTNNGTVSGTGDGLGFGFTAPSGDTLFASTACIARAVYAYPNQPYSGTQVTGVVRAGDTKFHCAPGGMSAITGKTLGRIVLVTGPAVTMTGTIWYTGATDSTCGFNASTAGDATLNWSGDQTVTVNVYPPDSTHWRVKQTVQIFRPPASGTFNHVFDANNYFRNEPESLAVCYSDSVATHQSEALPIAWRVYWQPPSTALPWLANNTTTSRWVDFVLHSASSGVSGEPSGGMYLYSLIARYARVDPMLLGYELDNVGAMGPDAVAAADTATYFQNQWPEGSTLASFRSYLTSQGVPGDFPMQGNADTLYAMATTTQNGHTYPVLANGNRFVPTSRDTVSADLLQSPTGLLSPGMKFGSMMAVHRLAFRDSAAATTGYARYGIAQRLIQSDSAITARFGQGRTAPYLSFEQDFSAPIDMRVGSYTGLNGAVAGNGGCPPDSFFLALRYAGKRYVRGFTSNRTPRTDAAASNWTSTPTTINGVANTAQVMRYFSRPDEVFTGQVPSTFPASIADGGCGVYRVRCVGAAAFTEIPSGTPTTYNVANATYKNPNSRARYCFLATIKLSTLLGMTTPTPTAYNTQERYGEAAIGSTAMNYLARSTDIGRVRMMNQQAVALQWTRGTLYRDYAGAKDCARIGVFSNIAALNSVAGYPLVRWVNPWQVYDK